MNSKVIFGLVFALSFSMFIGSTHHVYAAPITCNPNSTLVQDAGNGLPGCVCYNGFQQNGFANGQPVCISLAVGGMGIPIDSTALLLAGVQGSALWMVPAIVVAGAGIGIFSFRKSKKKQD